MRDFGAEEVGTAVVHRHDLQQQEAAVLQIPVGRAPEGTLRFQEQGAFPGSQVEEIKIHVAAIGAIGAVDEPVAPATQRTRAVAGLAVGQEAGATLSPVESVDLPVLVSPAGLGVEKITGARYEQA